MITLENLWSALNEEEITQGCIALFEPCHPVLKRRRSAAIERISEVRNIRLRSVNEYSPEKNASIFVKFVRARNHQDFWDDIIQAFLLGQNLPLISDFLAACGIEHDKGMFDGNESPSVEKFSEAIRSIRSKHSPRFQSLYFGYLVLSGGEFWENLTPALEVEKFDLLASLKSDSKSVSANTDESASPESSEPAPPESTPGLTALDATLIKTIVASSGRAEGALPEDQLEDAIEEFITMGSSRKQSFYHRGLFHVLFDHPLKFSYDGDNAERRAWYLSGVVDGFLRRGKSEEIAALLKSRPEVFEEACGEQARTGPMLLPKLYNLLLDTQEFHLLRSLLGCQFPRLRPNQQLEIAFDIQEIASRMLRNDQTAEAESVLREIGKHAHSVDSNASEKLQAGWRAFDTRNARKVAQCLQMKGDFKGAEKILLALLEQPDWATKGRVCCDIGLIRGKFRSIKQTFPPKEMQTATSLCRALKEGREFYLRAIEENPDDSANARFCLALCLILEKQDPQSAVDHLRSAYSAILQEEKAFHQAGVFQWTKFLLGLSLLESAEESALHYATDLLHQSLADPIAFPPWLWERALTASGIFTGATITSDIAIHLLKKVGADAHPVILRSGVVHSDPKMRETYIPMLSDLRLTSREKWQHLEEFLEICNREKDLSGVEAILDQMECIAQNTAQFRPRFLEIVQDSDKISLVWTPQEVSHTIIDLHERSGDLPQAIVLLQNLFHEVRAESDERRKKVELLDILEWLAHLRADPELIADLQDLAFGDDADPIAQGPETKEAPISLLYIGGNETQRQYEQTLKNEFAQEHPSWALEFYFPGWTSNWNDHLNAVKPKIRTSDAVILNTLVRTQFGRHVRKTCDANTPWFPCTGRGRASLKRSIEEAARWASKQKQNALN